MFHQIGSEILNVVLQIFSIQHLNTSDEIIVSLATPNPGFSTRGPFKRSVNKLQLAWYAL